MNVIAVDNAINLPRLASRAADSHKGDFGRALLVGGSRGMSGAIALAGCAALRGGAGLVKLAVPQSVQDVVAALEPSYMTIGLDDDAAGRLTAATMPALQAAITEATALAVGPGLGRSSDLTKVVADLYRNVARPTVLDADALNALAEQAEVLSSAGGPRIMTPHIGEFARLLGEEAKSMEDEKSRNQKAIEFAATYGVVLVLKSHRTLVTDGKQAHVNSTGNPGMATGGSGDVLTGVITALLCQGLAPLDAARLGVHVHGCAGDLASAELGELSVIASDLLRMLPAAWRSLRVKELKSEKVKEI